MVDTSAILTSVKLRESLTGASQDDLLLDLEAEMRQKILDYCQITELPDGLKSVLVSMVQDRYHMITESASESLGIVSSVSDGQQSVSYKSVSEVFKKSEGDRDLLSGYLSSLNLYRVIKFK
jgi:cation transport regulator ChaB